MCLIQKLETRERLYRGACGVVLLNITGKERPYHIIAEQHGVKEGNKGFGWWCDAEPVWTTTLQEIIMVDIPSKEQIAAEESVDKAKEALKAAENALKVLTSQKGRE